MHIPLIKTMNDHAVQLIIQLHIVLISVTTHLWVISSLILFSFERWIGGGIALLIALYQATRLRKQMGSIETVKTNYG